MPEMLTEVEAIGRAIKVVQIGKRRLALSAYRQIVETYYFDLRNPEHRILPRGELLGWVNIHPDCHPPDPENPKHYHVLWVQHESKLRRSRVEHSLWKSRSLKALSFYWSLVPDILRCLLRHSVPHMLTWNEAADCYFLQVEPGTKWQQMIRIQEELAYHGNLWTVKSVHGGDCIHYTLQPRSSFKEWDAKEARIIEGAEDYRPYLRQVVIDLTETQADWIKYYQHIGQSDQIYVAT